MTRAAFQLVLAASLLALATAPCRGQKASNWRVYRVADGLPERGCISVAVSPHGKVIAKHFDLPMATELDGYSVNLISTPEGVKSRLYESAGGQLWTVVTDGLQEFREGAWAAHPVPEIAAELRTSLNRLVDPIPLCPVRQGLLLFLRPDFLFEFNSEDLEHPKTQVLRAAADMQLQRFSGLTAARDGSLWISGARGLAHAPGPLRNLRPETPWREFVAPESLNLTNFQEPHEDAEGGITAVAESSTNHQKVIARFNGKQWSAGPPVVEKLRHAWRGPERNYWGMTTLGLFTWTEGQPEMTESEEISPRQYYDVAVEPSGAIWLATSDGLFRYAPLAWRTPASVQEFASPIRCLTSDAEGRVWFMAGSALHLLQDEQTRQFPFPASAARTLQSARAAFPLKDGSLLIDSGGQLFRFRPGSESFTTVPRETPGRELKILGALKDGSLCVQCLEPGGAGSRCSLERFDGEKFEPFPDTPPAVIGTVFYTLFTTKNGDSWLSAEAGTACYHENKWRAFVSTDKTAPEAASCFAEMPDGKIWCGTRDQVWEFDDHNWSVVRRGFEGINALTRSRDGSVWVASNNGLTRYFQGAWVENGVDEGLASPAIREFCEDSRGRLWAGTSRGLSSFHPEADPDPPQTTIQKPPDHELNLQEGGTITLSFTGQDKWKYTAPRRLLFSYRLDQQEWSPFQEASPVAFTDLPAGKHSFQVRAMDRNCNIDPKPDSLKFAVILPWYKEARLVLISLAGAAAALFFAGLAFNRHRQLLRSYAAVEKQVAERTRQLDVANRELLHSQKMNALGALAAGIAHDFNNILSIIKGSAQVIEDNLDNPEKIRVRADRINTVVEQGSGIVKAMLGFSRESEADPKPCELNAVVEDTMKLLGDRFLHEVHVSCQLASSLPMVLASRDFIQQILLNFIFNASESMTQNKRVVLTTSAIESLPGSLVLTPSQPGPFVAVSVQDWGCGILPENLTRIFEPFFTTKALSSRRGTGLGLSMVYELAKTLGAGLAVQSILDQGSTFTLILPVSPVISPQPA
jgi:signal transduction histidine kinase